MKKLERSLSLWSVIAIGIGGMLGSGIFVLPGLAAAKTGPSVWLAYLLAGLCVLPAALSKSELATAMPTTGGTYVFIERAFGPLFGTISGIGLWLSLMLKSSFALVGFGAYLIVLADLPLIPISLTFLFLILILNIFGVKKVGTVQMAIVSLSLIGLGILLIFGIPEVLTENLKPALTDGNYGLVAATAFVFVSYAGVTKVAAIAEEIKDPGRNLPIAMMASLLIVTFVYASVTFVLAGNIPIAQLSVDIKPIYTLAALLGGKTAGILAAILGVVTLISMANSGVLAASRFPFAMSRDNLLPPFLQKIHPKFLTPVVTIVLTCSLMALVITFFEVEKIAKLASAFKVMMFILVNGCVIVLRETAVQWYKPVYKSPLYPWMQIFGILSGIVLLVVLGALAIFAGLLIIVLGTLVYTFYGRHNSQRSGVLKMYGHRPALYLLYKRSRDKNDNEASSPIGASTNLDGALANQANIVVPLFGKERSPEMLVEMGAALAYGRKIQVVHLKEVPDITDLDALLIESPEITSLNRRITSMSEEKQADVDFESVVTHDLVETIHNISTQTHCRWLVAGWNGRSGHGGLFVRNPIGWLVTQIDSNFALFKDNGVRYIHKILIGMAPGKNNDHFIKACDRIGLFYDAEISLIRVADPDMGLKDFSHLKKESENLLKGCSSRTKLILEKGKQPVKIISQVSAAYDLLIIEQPGKPNNFLDVLLRTDKDKFAENAACSVLRLTIK